MMLLSRGRACCVDKAKFLPQIALSSSFLGRLISTRVSQASNGASEEATTSSNAAVLPSEVVIVGAARTPIGSFNGSLASLTAVQLGSVAIKAALERSGVSPENVDAVIMGNVLSSGLGQSPARQAALGSGLPVSADCLTVDKVCSSGIKAVMLAAQSIALGSAKVVVAGGMESMSNAPFLLARSFTRKKMGDSPPLRDSMLLDGLSDAYRDGAQMGVFAEECADEMKISRDDQDEHAVRSYERAIAATEAGILAREIAPVTVPGRSKDDDPVVVDRDDEITRFDEEKLRRLPPVYLAGEGTVTAGNSSTISDGAAALVLASRAFAEEQGLPVLATVVGMADGAQEPDKFATAPSIAIPRALQSAGVRLSDVQLFEINEAFSVVCLANERMLGLDSDEVNVLGGAVSLGHPIGTSGARILVTLLTAMEVRQAKFGVAATCNGGGGSSAVVIKREVEDEPKLIEDGAGEEGEGEEKEETKEEKGKEKESG